jgi:putative hydrolase
MHFEIDTHTHTVLSGHAHSTIMENAAAAARIGIKGIVMSDHGPSLHSAPPDYNIGTYAYLPDCIDGVRIYRGIEANIIDYKGSIDIREKFLKRLEFVIAGLHEVVIGPGGRRKNTGAMTGALNNAYVDIISHPDNPAYEIDFEAVVKETARLGKLMEVNDHSLEYRSGERNVRELLNLCKKHGARVAVSSDAHSAFGIGKFDAALKQIEANGFPESLIVNLTIERFEKYLEERRKRIEG